MSTRRIQVESIVLAAGILLDGMTILEPSSSNAQEKKPQPGAKLDTPSPQGDISGFDLRSMLLPVGGGVLVLFVFGLMTKARA
jgi:hypothetical protein